MKLEQLVFILLQIMGNRLCVQVINVSKLCKICLEFNARLGTMLSWVHN